MNNFKLRDVQTCKRARITDSVPRYQKGKICKIYQDGSYSSQDQITVLARNQDIIFSMRLDNDDDATQFFDLVDRLKINKKIIVEVDRFDFDKFINDGELLSPESVKILNKKYDFDIKPYSKLQITKRGDLYKESGSWCHMSSTNIIFFVNDIPKLKKGESITKDIRTFKRISSDMIKLSFKDKFFSTSFITQAEFILEWKSKRDYQKEFDK